MVECDLYPRSQLKDHRPLSPIASRGTVGRTAELDRGTMYQVKEAWCKMLGIGGLHILAMCERRELGVWIPPSARFLATEHALFKIDKEAMTIQKKWIDW